MRSEAALPTRILESPSAYGFHSLLGDQLCDEQSIGIAVDRLPAGDNAVCRNHELFFNGFRTVSRLVRA
jgi:hypothetical protein